MCPPTRPPLSVVFSKRFSDWHLTGFKTDFTIILTPESETLSFRHRSHCSLALHWFCIRIKNLVQFLKSGNSPSAPGSQRPFVQGAVKPGDLKRKTMSILQSSLLAWQSWDKDLKVIVEGLAAVLTVLEHVADLPWVVLIHGLKVQVIKANLFWTKLR